MRKLAALLIVAPGAALAHGGHAEITGIAHDTFHAGPFLGAVAVVVAVLALARFRGQDE